MAVNAPAQQCYYQTLGVTSTATPEQIKEAYRVAVKMFHPDVAGSSAPDAKKFRDVMEAFGVLSINESRANYDLLRRKNPDNYADVSEAEFA